MYKLKKHDLIALASIPLIMTLANSMLIPVLPLMQKKLGISSLQSSLIITIYAAVSIVCIPIAGYLSDRFGRKRIILIGLSLATIGGLISAFSAWQLEHYSAFYGILAGRFVQGIGAAGAFPIVIPLVGDMFDSKEEVSGALGVIETSNTFGKVISPILGSALTLLIWFLPLAVIPFISLISILAIGIFVKVPKKSSQQQVTLKSFLHSLRGILKEKGRWLYGIFAIGGCVMFIMFGFLYYLSSTLEDHYNIDGIKKGLLLAIPLSAICLSSYIAGKVIGTNMSRMKWINVVGSLILTSSMIICLLIYTKSMWILLILLTISGVGIGLVLPCLDALITEGIQKEQRGTITSLYSSMRFIGVAAGPLITALLLDKERLMFSIFAGTGLICSLIALFAIKPGKSKGK
ncbi:MFS transporter [Paenibacillus sp. N1-5-1-14]|uniref:MFS transporter n=1 Tax=Paenibacillus radicibacter TaxID=2972488 RepID=UPI00215972FC|nr:MFS transporter [Paenibacillus radicibacter]MCR8641766.1 MFS transporter [Paenibacillus radicibacter]